MEPELPQPKSKSWRPAMPTAVAALAAVAIVMLAVGGAIVERGDPPCGSTKDKSHVDQSSTRSHPSAELKQTLTPMQYEVTQHAATEPPFRNEFWDNHERRPLRRRRHAASRSSPRPTSSSPAPAGPASRKPVEPDRVIEHEDRTLRHDADRGALAGRRLAPGPRLRRRPRADAALRYCINSASLRFIPVSKLEAEGYGEYLPLFDGGKPATQPAQPSAASQRVRRTAAGRAAGLRDDAGDRDPRGRLLLGNGGPPPQDPRRARDRGRLHRAARRRTRPTKTCTPGAPATPRRCASCSIPRSSRTRTCSRSGSSACTTRPRRTARATTSARSTARRSSSPRPSSAKMRRGGEGAGRRVGQVEAADRRPRSSTAGPFTLAEDYHQKYLEKNPGGYTCHYMRD